MTAEQQKKFKYWQWRTIAGTMIGYIFFYLIRKNFSFLMPGLTAEYGTHPGSKHQQQIAVLHDKIGRPFPQNARTTEKKRVI